MRTFHFRHRYLSTVTIPADTRKARRECDVHGDLLDIDKTVMRKLPDGTSIWLCEEAAREWDEAHPA